jgi:xanthine dehydrogenase accessory factor
LNLLQSHETLSLLQAAQQALAAQTPATLVSVTATRGSAPRFAGAAMLVTNNFVTGTVGGGHLEHVAIELARSQCRWVHNPPYPTPQDTIPPLDIEYPLGAALGQCCGGAMMLRYELLTAKHVNDLQAATQQYKTLFLFGAGHVAQALVPLLAALPLRIVWADSREAINTHQAPFPSDLPTHITTVVSDTLEAELSAAQAGDLALIMSHSHALDESLVQNALRLPQLAYIGLIGSATKKRLFEQRLGSRGVSDADLQRLVCPIGIASPITVHSKLPAVIALQVAAQITGFL